PPLCAHHLERSCARRTYLLERSVDNEDGVVHPAETRACRLQATCASPLEVPHMVARHPPGVCDLTDAFAERTLALPGNEDPCSLGGEHEGHRLPDPRRVPDPGHPGDS